MKTYESNETKSASKHTSSSEAKRKKYKCKECMKWLSSKQSLREHKYSHSEIKPYTCAVCKKSFRHGSHFTIHKKTHDTRQDSLNWPKLTDLLRFKLEVSEETMVILERVKLPEIKKPEKLEIPTLSQYFPRIDFNEET